MELDHPMSVRSWKYVAVTAGGVRSQPYTINSNLTGAMLGDQKPAYITFRMALWILHGWNLKVPQISFRLLIPSK